MKNVSAETFVNDAFPQKVSKLKKTETAAICENILFVVQ